MVSRRAVQTLLGLIWLLESVLRFNSHHGAIVLIAHVTFAAVLQILLGLSLVFNVRLRLTLVLSTVWCIVLWSGHHGVGDLLSGQVQFLAGRTGTFLLQSFIGLAVWPSYSGRDKARGKAMSRTWNQRGIRFAQIALGLLFTLGFTLHFQTTYLLQTGLTQFIALPWLAALASYQGTGITVFLQIVELAMAVMFVTKFAVRWAVWFSIVLDILLWWGSQSLGQIFDPMTPSLASGILLAVLLTCANPHLLWRPRWAAIHLKWPLLH